MTEGMSDGKFRAGRGSITSPVAAKEGLGRTSFQRIKHGNNHEGFPANPTEYSASKRLAQKPPTSTEIKMVLDSNPNEVRSLRGANMKDHDIYEALKDRN